MRTVTVIIDWWCVQEEGKAGGGIEGILPFTVTKT